MKKTVLSAMAATVMLATTAANAHNWRNHYSVEVSYRVINVASWDKLNVRTKPHAKSQIVGRLRPGASGIQLLTCARHARWCKIEAPTNAGSIYGWVNMRFLGGYAY